MFNVEHKKTIALDKLYFHSSEDNESNTMWLATTRRDSVDCVPGNFLVQKRKREYHPNSFAFSKPC